jgi:glutaredoxin
MKTIASYTIFTTPTCHFCHDLEAWLTDKGVTNFQKQDVAADLAARQLMVEKSQQLGVPVSLIKFTDNTEAVVIGFAPKQLAEALEIGS